jgi:glycosyltransferase involved in cell wall biosynthesis
MMTRDDLADSVLPIPRRANGGTRKLPLDHQHLPLVSIIVVAFQERNEVAALIDNIASFRGNDLELVIIDGGSDDGTLELLQTRNEEVDYWLTEPDTGIYDAMNKGLKAAIGQYVLHINAGDRILRLPLAQLAMLNQRQIDVVCCRVLEDDAHLYTPRNDWLMRIDNTWHHQGTFYRRHAHLGYDPSYRVFGDFEHNQRLRKANKSVQLLDVVIAAHDTSGVSRNKDSRVEIFRSIRANFNLLYLLPAIVRFQLIKLRAAFRR